MWALSKIYIWKKRRGGKINECFYTPNCLWYLINGASTCYSAFERIETTLVNSLKELSLNGIFGVLNEQHKINIYFFKRK